MPQAAKQQRIPGAPCKGSSCERGYGYDWQRLRESHIASEPLCRECLARGVHELGIDVDHIIPHRGNKLLRLDPGNLQTLCKICHQRKTMSDQGK